MNKNEQYYKKTHQNYNLTTYKNLAFSQLCPQQPIIPKYNQTQLIKQLEHSKNNKTYGSQKFRVKKVNQHRQLFHHKSYEELQHERQMKSMKQRIKNCKCLSQRKKDHFDPIMYPTYFMRNQYQAKDISLQTYSRRILGTLLTKQIIKNAKHQKHQNVDVNNRKKRRSHQKQALLQVNEEHYHQSKDLQFQNTSYSPYVNRVQKYQYNRNKDLVQEEKRMKNSPYNYERNQNKTNFSLNLQTAINLPKLQSKQIVRFIIDKGLYKTSDLNILKARLIHQYGKDNTQPIWKHSLQMFYQDGFY